MKFKLPTKKQVQVSTITNDNDTIGFTFKKDNDELLVIIDKEGGLYFDEDHCDKKLVDTILKKYHNFFIQKYKEHFAN